ncbi:hypothetical protein MKW94_016024 [Papaver nudicaule]|uniref:Uncharacterized protein n=1 Tax=Papaver nudicaule TaxID=74823 RepID=A0AA42AXT5_PAPNU|nr:hypothetical protein [Papaver nudicaule]
MKLHVDVISREKIKPSRPTPTHLKTHNLSFLDQVAGRNYVPLLLYYDGNKENTDTDTRCSALKESLAETLTKFYLLAGKIVDDEIERFVHCNDDGVDFCETRVRNCQLSQVIKEPDFFEQLKLLLPFDPCDHETTATGAFLLSVQANIFEDCGGMVIGLYINHKVADASSFATFVNDWATVARCMVVKDYDRKINGPSFEVQSLFPQKENGIGFKIPLFPADGTQVTKKFAFQASKLAELKERCTNEAEDVLDGYKPTRVEALSTFLWKCFIDIDQAKLKAGAPARLYIATNAVNIRSRMVPQLPTSSFGNMVAVTDAIYSISNSEGTDRYYPKLVKIFRDAVKKIDEDYIAALQSTDFILNHMMKLIEHFFSGQTLSISFSSWCRFPLYDANFGWGNPTWVSSCSTPLKNAILLMDSNSSGDGIEAYVTLAKEDMVEFERHEELLELIS